MPVKFALAPLPLAAAVALGLLGLHGATAAAAQIDFALKAGTGDQPWNTQQTTIEVKVGDTLHLINLDTIPHRLHTTDGEPCAHGTEMLPGGCYDCVITKPFDPALAGPLYDHNVGETAAFWVHATL